MPMRLGGPIFAKWDGPEEWAAAVRALGYRAAYCPLPESADDATVRAFEQAAAQADVVIAEVGAWSNPLSPNEETSKTALRLCRERLALADRIGARCCVNIAGSRGEQWDGHDPLNLTPETFDRIVEYVRAIIDDVKPTRTYYSLETMPWMYPNSVESYERLLRAIDRPAFAVHFDPVNLVCSPELYYSTGALIRDFVERLGSHIKSCHAKDILLSGRLTTHLDETRPGQGGLDYPAFLRAVATLPADTPVMLEHLPDEAEYAAAAQHVRSVANELGLQLDGAETP
jgi:sugar phosphate isomerase/epimerase